MAKIKKTTVQKYFLPSFEDLPEEEQGWVELETPMRMEEFGSMDTTLPQVEQTASLICLKLKKWNLTDDDEKPLEINNKNVAALDPADFAFMSIKLGLDKLMRLTAQKKTNFGPTSPIATKG